MKVNELLNVVETETLSNQGIVTIIPLEKKFSNLNDLELENEEISAKEKVVFNSEGLLLTDEDNYAPFGIEPCFQSDDEEDDGYELIDVKTSKDGYDFVYNEEGEVWIVLE
ncbi:MAG: hypothetical protein IKP65_01975 [Alphaproteobacteria bacterium]|nr:hypothetical protein [Alphaproteobacteria bacterium]